MISTLVSIYFGRAGRGHTIKTIDPELSLILTFYKKTWG